MRRLCGLMTILAGLALVVPFERALAQLPAGCVRQSTAEDDDHATERCRMESLYGKDAADQMIHLRNGPTKPPTYYVDREPEPERERARQGRAAVRPPGAQSTRPYTNPSAHAQTVPPPPRDPRLVRLSAQGAAIVAFAEVGSIPPSGQPMPQAARIWSLAVYRNGANYGGKPAAAYWQLYDFDCGEQIATLTALVAIDGQANVVGTSAANARGQVKNGTTLSAIWALACGMAQNSGPRLASAQAAIAASVPATSSQLRQQPKPRASSPRSPSMQDCKLDAVTCAAVENDAQKALEKILRGE